MDITYLFLEKYFAGVQHIKRLWQKHRSRKERSFSTDVPKPENYVPEKIKPSITESQWYPPMTLGPTMITTGDGFVTAWDSPILRTSKSSRKKPINARPKKRTKKEGGTKNPKRKRRKVWPSDVPE